MQGQTDLEGRGPVRGYPIQAVREACLRLLLNLALSAHTAKAVMQRAALRDGLKLAAADEANLSKQAKHLISDVEFQMQMADGSGISAAIERVHAAAAAGDSARHVMLSYCWEQQKTVLRVRKELGNRGCSIWIDVEQMAGSTVDSMADAIDGAYAVIVSISRDYKESPACKIEALYAHSAGVKMVPMMLSDQYKPNGCKCAIGQPIDPLPPAHGIVRRLNCPLITAGLGMLLNCRLWYGFFGETLADEAKFQAKITEMCRELSAARQEASLTDAPAETVTAGPASAAAATVHHVAAAAPPQPAVAALEGHLHQQAATTATGATPAVAATSSSADLAVHSATIARLEERASQLQAAAALAAVTHARDREQIARLEGQAARDRELAVSSQVRLEAHLTTTASLHHGCAAATAVGFVAIGFTLGASSWGSLVREGG